MLNTGICWEVYICAEKTCIAFYISCASNLSSMHYGWMRLNCISETDLCFFVLSHQITAIKNHWIKRGIQSDSSPAPFTEAACNAPVQVVKAHVWTWDKGTWQKQDGMNPHENNIRFSSFILISCHLVWYRDFTLTVWGRTWLPFHRKRQQTEGICRWGENVPLYQRPLIILYLLRVFPTI